MKLRNPDESNPLLMPELVSVALLAASFSLVTAVVGVIHWLA